MKELQIFDNAEFGEIRMVEIEGKPYAVGIDVARALEYVNPGKAVRTHCKGGSKLGIPSNGGVQETTVIPEGDIIRLITKAADQSKSETVRVKAEKFESWIFDEVIPQVLHTGSYSVKQAPKVDTSSQDRAKAMLLNARTRQATLLMQLATQTRTDTYKEVITAKATNLLAGENLLPMPACANQRARHELGYFCKMIGKDKNWASALGRKLNAAGIKKIPGETGEYVDTTCKGNNDKLVQNFEWYDDYLMPKLVELFSKNKTEG